MSCLLQYRNLLNSIRENLTAEQLSQKNTINVIT